MACSALSRVPNSPLPPISPDTSACWASSRGVKTQGRRLTDTSDTDISRARACRVTLYPEDHTWPSSILSSGRGAMYHPPILQVRSLRPEKSFLAAGSQLMKWWQQWVSSSLQTGVLHYCLVAGGGIPSRLPHAIVWIQGTEPSGVWSEEGWKLGALPGTRAGYSCVLWGEGGICGLRGAFAANLVGRGSELLFVCLRLHRPALTNTTFPSDTVPGEAACP